MTHFSIAGPPYVEKSMGQRPACLHGSSPVLLALLLGASGADGSTFWPSARDPAVRQSSLLTLHKHFQFNNLI